MNELLLVSKWPMNPYQKTTRCNRCFNTDVYLLLSSADTMSISNVSDICYRRLVSSIIRLWATGTLKHTSAIWFGFRKVYFLPYYKWLIEVQTNLPQLYLKASQYNTRCNGIRYSKQYSIHTQMILSMLATNKRNQHIQF